MALVAVPLLVNPSGGFAFSVYKAAFLRTLVGLMVAAYVLRAGFSLAFTPESWLRLAHNPQGAIRGFLKAPLMGPLLALALVYLLATALSVSPSVSLWGSAERMHGTYTTLAILAFFLVVAREVRTTTQVNRTVWAIIIGSSLVSVLGIAELLGWSPWLLKRPYDTSSVSSTMGNPVTLGAYLVPTTALLTGKLAHQWASWRVQLHRRVALWLAGLSVLLAVHLAALLFTSSRGSWLGFATMLVAFFAVLLVRNRRWRALRLAALLLALGIVFLLGLSLPASPLRGLRDLPYLSRVTTLTDLGAGSGHTRVVIWGATKDLIISGQPATQTGDPWSWARPLVGYGPETLRQTFESVFPPELNRTTPGTRVDRAHNLILDLAVTVGLLGLLAFGSVVGLFFFHAARLLKRTRRWEEQLLLVSLIAAVAGYLVSGLVGVSAHADELVFWTLLALLVALALGVAREEQAQPHQQASLAQGDNPPVPASKWVLPVFAALAAAIGVLVFSVYVNGNLVWADMQTRRGADFINEARWTEAASSLEQALRSPPLRAFNDLRLAQVYSFQALEAASPAERARLLELSSDRIEEARALEPAEAGYHQRAALIYTYWMLALDPAKYSEAVAAFAAAAAASPNRVTIYNQWADLEARSGNVQRAFDLLGRSLEIDPEWAPTYHYASTVHTMIGKDSVANADLRRSIRLCATMWQGCLDFAEVLIGSGQAEDARLYVEEFVRGQPHIWRGRFLLAQAYLRLGLAQAAREEAAIALSQAPAAGKKEVQRLLDALR